MNTEVSSAAYINSYLTLIATTIHKYKSQVVLNLNKPWMLQFVERMYFNTGTYIHTYTYIETCCLKVFYG